MGFIQDILPIFKKQQLIFKEKRHEVGDIVTFALESQEKLNWKPGQHGVFNISHIKIKKATRALSLASTPQEQEIIVSMRVSENPSEFKRALMEMTPGTTVTMRGPIGPFYIKDAKPVLFIAGGIGITPYRSLLKDCISNPDKMPHTIELLYVDSKGQYLYKNELDEFSQHASITIKYLSNRNELTKEIKSYIKLYNNNAHYFASGTGTMINSVKELLKQEGIKKKHITSDVFVGY